MHVVELLSYFTVILQLLINICWATNRYYQTYISYGTGDTIIAPFHAHGGSMQPHRKWNVECLDGEAMVGISDWQNDFIRLEQVWCKLMFPYKPPTNGLYPYYPRCHVRNVTDRFHCYEAAQHELTSNTFVTGVQSANLFFWIHRLGIDNVAPFKCCKTPLGYYIDYLSCYYVTTHDMYFEYYDTYYHFLVYCTQGYVMAGFAKKINPYTTEYRYDWIQCCRVGFGAPINRPPPVSYMRSGVPAYRSEFTDTPVTGAYRSQYRSTADTEEHWDDDPVNNSTRKTDHVRANGTGKVNVDPDRLNFERILLETRGIRVDSKDRLSQTGGTGSRRVKRLSRKR